jgi:CBS domain-containing protein
MRLGFAPVYDYTLGKVDWMAAGLSTVRAGQASRRVLDAIRRDVPTCAADTPAGLALQQARLGGWDRCVVLAGPRIVVGMLRTDRISATEQATAAEVMQPGPSTVRAHDDLDATRHRMHEHHVAQLLVTTPDGTLLGVLDADAGTEGRPEAAGAGGV